MSSQRLSRIASGAPGRLAKSSAWPASKLPLQRQAALRVLRERRFIVGLQIAEVALGLDVQPDRLQHARAEQAAQEGQHEVLVLVVRAAQRGRAGPVGDQVPQVVQQAGGDQFGAGVVALGQRGGLQRVAQVADGLAVVGAMSAFGTAARCLARSRPWLSPEWPQGEALDGRAQPAAGAISRKRAISCTGWRSRRQYRYSCITISAPSMSRAARSGWEGFRARGSG